MVREHTALTGDWTGDSQLPVIPAPGDLAPFLWAPARVCIPTQRHISLKGGGQPDPVAQACIPNAPEAKTGGSLGVTCQAA